jgi:hypothetical protein
MNHLPINRRKRLGWFFLIIWIMWCGWWFMSGLCTYFASCSAWFGFEHLTERRMVGSLMVMLAGFPSGFFLPAISSDLMRYLGFSSFDAGALGYVIIWLMASVAGYLQWFILLPWLCRRLKALYRKLKA